MKIGSCLGGFDRTKFNLEQRTKITLDAGFEAVDMDFIEPLMYSDIVNGTIGGLLAGPFEKLVEFFEPSFALIKKYGAKIGQSHAPYPTTVEDNPEMNAFLKQAMISTLKLCGHFGVPYLVIHPLTRKDWVYGDKKFERTMKNVEYFSELIPYALENNVKICLEDLFVTDVWRMRYVDTALSSPEELLFAIDTLNEKAGKECFCACLDIGHAFLIRRSVTEYTKILGNRIQVLHLHDNDGIKDLHRAPYDGGLMNWDAVCEALKDINYGGDFSYEILYTSGNELPLGTEDTRDAGFWTEKAREAYLFADALLKKHKMR